MALFSRQSQFDLRVKEIFSKANSEQERQLKCLTVAQLYYQVGVYDKARHYIQLYLKQKPASLAAHKLLAQALSAQQLTTEALNAWDKCYQLMSSNGADKAGGQLEEEVVTAGCRLALKVPATSSHVQQWLSRGRLHVPRDPLVQQLHEHALQLSGVGCDGGGDIKQLEKILTAGVAARPLDVASHCRLAELLSRDNRHSESFSYVCGVQRRRVFDSDEQWLNTVADVCQRFSSSKSEGVAEVLLTHLSAVDQLLELQLFSGSERSRLLMMIHRFDQLVYRLSICQLPKSASHQARAEHTWQLQHNIAQLCFRTASLLLLSKQSVSDDIVDMARALLKIASEKLPLDSRSAVYQNSTRKEELEWYRERAVFRVLESRQCLLSYDHALPANSRHSVAFNPASDMNLLYNRLFGESQSTGSVSSVPEALSSSARSSSALLTLQLTDTDLSAISSLTVNPADILHLFIVEYLSAHRASLPRIVWLLRHFRLGQHGFSSHVSSAELWRQLTPEHVPSAPVSSQQLSESLTRLDMMCFLQATLCVSEIEMPSLSSLEALKPFSVSRPFCTEQQQQWWDAVNQLYAESSRPRNFSQLRQRMTHGLAVVQCVNSSTDSGLSSPHVLLALADWCQQQAEECEEEREALLTRMVTYLSAAHSVLTRCVNSTRAMASPASSKSALFVVSERSQPAPEQLAILLDSCSCRLAARCRVTGQLTRSLDYVTSLVSADSAYQRALTLLCMSEEEVGQNAREKLRQAKEAFYLTLDRLRGGSMCHDRLLLDRELAGQITAVEDKLLDDIRDATQYVNGDDSSVAVLPGTPLSNVASSMDRRRLQTACTSTPLRSHFAAGNGNNNNNSVLQTRSRLDESVSAYGMEVRPSPERISAELRNLDRTQQTILQLLLDRSTAATGSNTAASAVPEAVTAQLEQFSFREREMKQKLDSLSSTVESLQKEMSDLRLEVRTLSTVDTTSAGVTVPPQLSNPELYNYMAWAGQYQAALRGFPAAQYGYGAASLPFAPTAAATAAFQPSLAAHAAPGYLPFQQLPEDGPGMMGVGSAGFNLDSMGHQLHQPTTAVTSQQQPSVSSVKQEVKVPGNVTVSISDTLPVSQGSFQATQLPSVVVPPEHRKPPSVLSDLLNKSPVISMSSLTPSSSFSLSVGNQLHTSVGSQLHTPASSAGLTPSSQPPHSFQISVPTQSSSRHAEQLAEFMSAKPAFSAASLSSIPDRPVGSGTALTSPAVKQSPARDRFNSSGSFQEETDYEPMAHFQPVVELPLVTELVTGEEGHDCLFAGACKLLRFVGGEWKERGVGELRVMRCVDDDRCRVVMRRTQTHKLCANHYIVPSMKLVLMKNRTRDFVWAAKDFADEVEKDETLCARFKTDELAEEFRTAFEKAKSLNSSSFTSGKAPAATARESARLSSSSAHTTVNMLPTTLTEVRENHAEDSEEEEEDLDEEESEEEEPLPAVACQPNFSFKSSQSESSKNLVFSFSADKTAQTSTSSAFSFIGKPATSKVSFSFGFPSASKSTSSVFSTTTTISSASSSSLPAASTTLSSTPTVFGGFTFTTKATVISVASDTTCSTVSVAKSSSTTTTATTKSSSAGLFSSFSFGGSSSGSAAGAGGSQAASGTAGGSLFGSGISTAALDFASVTQAGSTFKVDPSFKGFSGAGCPVFSSSASPSAAEKNNTSTGEGEDHYEPNVQFKPVIDLPDLVEVKTGEESEELLFCHRAKLYRMDDQLKEWKERGLGDIKVLRNPGTHTCRVLMRRDQVFKLCANHAIGAGMKLSRLASSETAWVWSALDYSDGEENREKLAVKFKTVETAEKFKTVFESCADPNQTPPTPISSKSAEIPSTRTSTESAAQTSAKSVETPATQTKSSAASVSTVATPTPVAFTFGSASSFPSTNGFSGTTPSVFGGASSSGTGGFHFGGVKPLSPVKSRSRNASVNADSSVAGAGEETGNDYYEGDEGEHLIFQPVIALPDEVEVRTGEEDELLLYSHRCKLYRFSSGGGDGGEWKERGLGDIKLLLGDCHSRVRVLMRREPVMKLCLNQWLTDEQRFAFKDPRTVTWAGLDCSDGEPSRDLFAARFKTAEVAEDFVKNITDAQKRLSSGEGFKQGDLTVSKSAADKACDDDVVVVAEVTATPAEQAAAERLQLPAGFYLYKKLPDCPGCRGCRDEMPGEHDSKSTLNLKSNTSTPASSSVSSAAVTAASASSSAAFSFSFAPSSTSSVQSSTAGNSTGFVFGTALTGKSSVFGGSAASTTGSVFGGVVSPAQSGKSVFGGSSPAATSASFAGISTPTQPAKSLFGGASPAVSSTSSLFGVSGAPTQFTKSVFGEVSSSSSTSVFGGCSVPSTSSSSLFSATVSPAKSVFSASSSVEALSGAPPAFSTAAVAATTASFVFGGGSSVFGSGAAATVTSSAPSAGAGFVFGSAANMAEAKSSPSTATSTATGAGLFSSTATGLFSSAGPSLDFASLAKQSASPIGFNKAADFKFAGEGSAVFSSRAKPSASEPSASSETDTADADSAEAHDPQFEPVVPLPDLVEVVTGEENDETVFCSRAVLYRFDKSQWKERGRGEMKILYNSTTRTHRVLLRRDQVHKLACHHRISESLTLKPLGTSTNAWMWSSVDHAEDEAKPELFAVKFKTQALADEFRDVFETAVKAAASNLSTEGADGHVTNGDCQETEEDGEDGEYGEEEDGGVRFTSDVTLYRVVCKETQELGYGMLAIYEDNLMRVTMTDEKSEVLCDHYIATNSSYEVDGCCVEWTVNDDYVHQSSEPSKFRVFLRSADEADSMACALQEGLELAQASE